MMRSIFSLMFFLPASPLLSLDRQTLKDQVADSYKYLWENISPQGTLSGTIIASPSRTNPNYYFHWVRDGALVALSQAKDIPGINAVEHRQRFLSFFRNYIAHTNKIQNTTNPSSSLPGGSLGEPKFLVDGEAFTGDWGRPQHDGPPLRALAIIRSLSYIQTFLPPKSFAELRESVYRAELPATSVLKRDLEYVAHHWSDKGFDLWEEVYGHHFFTLQSHRLALAEGALFARSMGDTGAADFYAEQAVKVDAWLVSFWDQSRGMITTHKDIERGFSLSQKHHRIDQKWHNLDSSVLISALLAPEGTQHFHAFDKRVQTTAVKIFDSFQAEYPINQTNQQSFAIGRYPGDTYSGYHSQDRFNDYGNPWFLTTFTYADYFCQLSKGLDLNLDPNFLSAELRSFVISKAGLSPSPSVTELSQGLRKLAMTFFATGLEHRTIDNRLSEQYHRLNGFQQGAKNLTWSYSSYIEAASRCLK